MNHFDVKYHIASLMKMNVLIFVLGGLILLSSCSKLNPEEPAAAFIHIDSFTISQTDAIGSTDDRITDAWVTVNGSLLGVFELPADIPVYPQDTNRVFIQAGIMVNGMVETRVPYPFYTTFIDTIELEAKKTTTIIPEIAYKNTDQLEIIYVNDFETGKTKLEIYDESHVDPMISYDEVYEGGAALHIQVGGEESTQSLALFKLDEIFNFPQLTSEPSVMMELNYKCDHNFSIGLELNTGDDFENRWPLTLSSTNGQWKKNYINLGGTMSHLEYVDHKATIGITLSPDSTQANLYIDNLKVISTK